MKSLISLVVLVCAFSASSFAADSCATGRCLKAPAQFVAGVAGETVEVASNVVGGAVRLTGSVVGETSNMVVAAGTGVKAVVSAPVRRVTAVTQNTARYTVSVVKRPFRRVVCR